MKKKIGVLICMMLLLSMTFSVVNGKNINKDNSEITNYLENSPPSNPVLTAPDSATKNSKFVIKATSTDPEGDQIYYRFKIEEDSPPRSWKGPYNSGYQFKLNVRLIGYSGDLIIGFQAKDSNNAESEWSYHTITYSRERPRTFAFEHLLRSFPLLSQILKL